MLSVLSQSPAFDVAQLAEEILPQLGGVTVLQNRTGIVMLPATDTAKGVSFHLGEVLMAEAHIRVNMNDGAQVDGYGACLGRDTTKAMALAVIDAAHRAGVWRDVIDAFVVEQSELLQSRDAELMRKVETTRVEMETF
jgi:alpha-D-ribose 1-methylphosphonate 5-triphosphate synthase subunit PhnG